MATLTRYSRLFVLTLTVALVPAIAAAQAPYSTIFGIKAGVNSSTLSSDPDSDLSQLIGLVLGAYAGRHINDNLGVQVEALFSQRGAKEQIGSVDTTVRMNYLDIPVLARFGKTNMDGMHFHAFTGPQIGLNLSAKVKEDGGQSFDLKDEVKGTDFAWVLGAGVERNRWNLDARFTLGLSNIDNSQSDAKIKNRTISVMAGYRLK